MPVKTRRTIRDSRFLISLVAVNVVIASCILIPSGPLPQAHALGTLTVTGVSIDNSSVKVDFQAVGKAADYRIYDVAKPTRVKYAGQVYNGSTMVPATEIEWNSLDDNQDHTLVVQAVDKLGPVPHGNQYDSSNTPLVSPLPAGSMLGGDSGATADGNTSINGQGPSTNAPTVIAQSAPFVVQANRGLRAIPSGSDAQQTFFDTFDNSEASTMTQTAAADPSTGTQAYELGKGSASPWKIQYQLADVTNSMPFIADGHFMDMLFDGGTPKSNNPLHVSYGSMALLPERTADISGGRSCT